MASIVYEGVPGNGDLFAGMKFFILQKVPARNTLVNNVESNGGEVKPLENQADMIIADHARKFLAPNNSFSWKYIEDSVKNGELQDKEKYRIHSASSSNASPAARTTGTVIGGSRPNKPTRTPYTPADDRFLLQWVAKAVQRGMAPLGNLVYKQLEQENPRHPWQSWLDRYKTKYRYKPLPDVTNDDGPGPVNEAVRHQYSRPQVARQTDDVKDDPRPVTETVQRQSPRPPQARRQAEGREDNQDANEDEESLSQGSPDIVERLARHAPEIVEYQEFSKDDDDLLISEYDAILNIEREGTSVIKAWSAFAKGHGRHTGDEWYHYFHTVIKKTMDEKSQSASKARKPRSKFITIDDDDEADVEAEEHPGVRKKVSKSAVPKKVQPVLAVTEDHEMREDARSMLTKEEMRAEKVTREHEIENEREISIFAESDRGTGGDQEDAADQDMDGIDFDLSQNSADVVPAPVLRNKSTNMSFVPKVSAFTKPRSARKQLNAAAHYEQDESVSEEKAAFLEDLRTVARATHKQIEPRQEVCGTHIQLYDLWNTVNNKFDGFEEVDAGDTWGRVATQLGFSISKHPDVSKELRNLYTTFLVKVKGNDQTPDAVKPKATAVNSGSETPKQQGIVSKATVSKPGLPPASKAGQSSAMGSQSQAKNVPASSIGAPKLPRPKKIAKSEPLNVRTSASINSKALPERRAHAAPSEQTEQALKVPTNNLGATATPPSPIQLKTGIDYMKTSTGHLEGVDDEVFTKADLVMLAKLVDFAKECLDIPIQRTGSPICGRWVSLPKFRKVVNALGGYNTVTRKKLWKQVSLDLGYFPTNKYTSVPEELQEAYEEVLMDYDEYRKKVRNLRESMGAQELHALGDEDSGVAVPQTSPRQTGSASSQKRARNAVGYDSPANVPDTFKRRRLDRKGKGKEIQAEVPGTPEHIYNSSMLSQEASVVKDSQIMERSPDSDSDATEAYQPIRKPLFKKFAAAEPPLAVDEPETQEFSFVHEEESPSRQLNSEAMASVGEYDGVKPGGSDIQEYYAMCESEGYSQQVAVRTLAAANMNPELAKKILNRVARGQPIPDNIKGIWTSRDDDILMMDLPLDHPDMVNLRKKHGPEEVEDRMLFHESLGEEAEDEDE